MKNLLLAVFGALLVVALAGTAQAQDWTTVLGSCRNVKPGTVCDYLMNDETTDSAILPVGSCHFVSVQFDPDADGANTGAEVYIRRCAGETTCSTCPKVLADKDGDGIPNDETLTGDATVARAGFQELQAAGVCVEGSANTAADGYRVRVVCH